MENFNKIVATSVKDFLHFIESKNLKEIKNELVFLKRLINSPLVDIKVNEMHVPSGTFIEFGPDNILHTDFQPLKDFRLIRTIFHDNCSHIKCLYGLDRYNNPTKVIF